MTRINTSPPRYQPVIERDLIPSYVMRKMPFHHAPISGNWHDNYTSKLTYTVWVRGCPTYVWDEEAQMWFDAPDPASNYQQFQSLIKPREPITTLRTYTDLNTLQRYGAGHLVAQMIKKARA